MCLKLVCHYLFTTRGNFFHVHVSLTIPVVILYLKVKRISKPAYIKSKETYPNLVQIKATFILPFIEAHAQIPLLRVQGIGGEVQTRHVHQILALVLGLIEHLHLHGLVPQLVIELGVH